MSGYIFCRVVYLFLLSRIVYNNVPSQIIRRNGHWHHIPFNNNPKNASVETGYDEVCDQPLLSMHTQNPNMTGRKVGRMVGGVSPQRKCFCNARNTKELVAILTRSKSQLVLVYTFYRLFLCEKKSAIQFTTSTQWKP